MTHPLGETSGMKIVRIPEGGDPGWLKALRAVALVLGIVIMLIFLISLVTLYNRFQEVGDVLEGPSIEEQIGETELDEPVPSPSSYWTENGPDGEPLYCYTEPEFGEKICEVIE